MQLTIEDAIRLCLMMSKKHITYAKKNFIMNMMKIIKIKKG